MTKPFDSVNSAINAALVRGHFFRPILEDPILDARFCAYSLLGPSAELSLAFFPITITGRITLLFLVATLLHLDIALVSLFFGKQAGPP